MLKDKLPALTCVFVQHLHPVQVTVKLLKEYKIVDRTHSPPKPTNLADDERKVCLDYCAPISLHNLACIIVLTICISSNIIYIYNTVYCQGVEVLSKLFHGSLWLAYPCLP